VMIDLKIQKDKLEKELLSLEKDLGSIGRRNPSNPEDWEATPAPMDISSADKNEMADGIEEFEDNTAVLKQLETRYNEVKKALGRIDAGTYGKCDVGGASHDIEEDRLLANPAAATCKTHLKS